MPETPTLAELIDIGIESQMLDVHTALPGKVVTYDQATQTADIQIQTKRILRTEDDVKVTESLPELPCVPVVFPRAGAFSITFPLAAGDGVLVVFNETSIDRYRDLDSEVDPGDDGRHDLSGAVAIPGFFAAPQKLTSSALDAAAMVMAGDIKLGSSAASDLVALKSLVEAQLQVIVDAIKGGVPVANDGGAALQTSIVALLTDPVTNVGATKVKAE